MTRAAALALLLALAGLGPVAAEVRLSPGEEIGHVERPSGADGREGCIALSTDSQVGHMDPACRARRARRPGRGA